MVLDPPIGAAGQKVPHQRGGSRLRRWAGPVLLAALAIAAIWTYRASITATEMDSGDEPVTTVAPSAPDGD